MKWKNLEEKNANNMEALYEIVTVSLAGLIVITFMRTVYYAVKYLIITKAKKDSDWLIIMQGIISLWWVVIFGYITEESIFSQTPIAHDSFGSLFIRPMLLLSSSVVSIWMYIRYKFVETKGGDKWNLLKD